MRISAWSAAKRLLNDVVDLVYPQFCPGCNKWTPLPGEIFCIRCYADLPLTFYHLIRDNPVEKQLWGRFAFESAASFLFFVPGGITQHLLHNIKYRGQRQFALEIGKMYGHQLISTPRFNGISMVAPIPLHWKKLHKRGFNQSLEFARGIAESMQVETSGNALVRVRSTQTQTRKSRFERLQNTAEAFRVNDKSLVAGSHILLVDDVITTGATLEAASSALLAVPDVRISIATIACGRV